MNISQDVAPVHVQNLSKSFGQGSSQVRALEGVSLHVGQGEHLAVIGPSGSGKSTLLHLIAGLTSPSAGTVTIDGKALAGMSDCHLTLFRRRHIGMVFQAYNLIPTLSVEDNIRLPLLLERGRSTDDQKVESLLETLGLKDRRRHRPDQLSGGEQQRVAIGRAMVTDPTVILADEPSGNLDFANSRKLCELMHRLCTQQSRTIITVTHDPNVAMWAHRVVVLKDGQVVEILTPSAFSSARELGTCFQDILERKEAGTCA